jgi:PAS domain S-box-containing protein
MPLFQLDGRHGPGIALVIGLAYFLATWLGLTLRSHAGVAIFCPAAGIAVGAMIAAGPQTRLSITVAVAVAGAIASSLVVGRSPGLALAFGFLGAGQALLTVCLIERWFGGVFRLDDVRQVLGLLVAGAAGAALSAMCAATATALADPSGFLGMWQLWFAATLLGMLTAAPLWIGLGEAVREPPPRHELLEGTLALFVLVLMSMLVIALPEQPRDSDLTLALMLPVLLWITVRCRPVFAAAAATVLALAIIGSTTFNFGHFGGTSMPIAERTLAGQTHVLAVSLLALVLAALFAERRSREALLEASNERLWAQKETFTRLLGSLPAAIYTTDKDGHITYCNEAAVDLWGTRPELGKDKWSDLWRLHYPDGTSVPLDQRPTQIALSEGRAVRGREALLERPDGTLVPIMPCPAPLIDAQGNIIGVVNMQLDLAERKRAETALAERDTLLTLASKAARVGSYSFDCATETVRLTPGCAALYGFPGGTTQLARAEARACVHPEDLSRLDAGFTKAFSERQRELVTQFRIIRPSDGQVRWIESRCLVSYEAGQPVRIVGIDIDLTERRQAEAEIQESETRLADALAAGQVIAFEWDAATHRSRRSTNAAAILGYEAHCGIRGLAADGFFRGVHPDDRERFKASVRCLRPDAPAYALSFRFRSPDGRDLWLEETAKGEFDAAGQLLRIKGLTRNITDRIMAERALAERNLQLSLAAKAALVGSFTYDVGADEIQISDGYAAIHGLPEGTGSTTRTVWARGVHPDDRRRVDEVRRRSFREGRRDYGTEYRIIRASGDTRWIEARCFVSYRSDGSPDRVVGVNIDVTERKRAERHQRMLVAELDHRVKNVLATVSAVASRTQDASASAVDFAARLTGRIQSMAATHELLSCKQWTGVALRELVQRELAPYAAGSNTDVDGPDLTLCPETGQRLSMVLHELTTNAAKHGALSTQNGRVSVRWSRVRNGSAVSRLRIQWRETDGPVVRQPQASSYGTEVIRNLIPYELDGTVDLAFEPEGLRCDIDIPLAALGDDNREGSLRIVNLEPREQEIDCDLTT